MSASRCSLLARRPSLVRSSSDCEVKHISTCSHDVLWSTTTCSPSPARPCELTRPSRSGSAWAATRADPHGGATSKGRAATSAGPRSPPSISPRRMSAAPNEQPFRGSVIQDHEPGSSQATRSGSALLLDRIGRCCRPLDGRQGGCRSASDHPGSGCPKADILDGS